MTDVRHERLGRQTARHEVPAIDEAALVTARWADRMLAAAKDLGSFTGSYMATNVPGHTVVMLKIVSTP